MWKKVPPRMRKEFTFENFEQAMDFVNKVAKVAESLNHHPDIHISYSKEAHGNDRQTDQIEGVFPLSTMAPWIPMHKL